MFIDWIESNSKRGYHPIKNNKKNIPQATINRLSIYHRSLESFIKVERSEGIETISSSKISELTGINPNQIRKDLSYFGEFGKRGIGYPVNDLLDGLKKIFRSSKKWDIILAGAGNIGKAFIRYQGFPEKGFTIRSVFDSDISKVGRAVSGIEILHIRDMVDYIRKQKIKIGMITVPAESAQDVADKMIAGGIKSILNFAPIRINHPKNVRINNIDIAIELERLVYYLSNEQK